MHTTNGYSSNSPNDDQKKTATRNLILRTASTGPVYCPLRLYRRPVSTRSPNPATQATDRALSTPQNTSSPVHIIIQSEPNNNAIPNLESRSKHLHKLEPSNIPTSETTTI